jgi:hypothetical protein
MTAEQADGLVDALLKMRRFGYSDGFDAALVYAAMLMEHNPARLREMSEKAFARLTAETP